MRNRAVVLFLAQVIICVLVSSPGAEEPWMKEFEDITSRTEESSTMGRDELTAIIDRCDRLKETIEKSDSPQKNIYIFRLEKAKKLFSFVLESEGK